MIFDLIISVFLVIAGIFGLVGSYGLVKLPDLMTRLHASYEHRFKGTS